MDEKRNPSDLMPFFLLANISRGGLQSLYELQRGVGLQPGGMNSILRRLERAGLLMRRPPERRRRRKITITEQGERILSTQWQACLRPYPDPESTLRAAFIAVLMGERRHAEGYLEAMANQYEQNLPVLSESPSERQSPADWYASGRTAWERGRRCCAADVFRKVARKLQGMERQLT